MKFAITMRPTSLPKNYGKSRGAEFLYELEANSKEEAVQITRRDAEKMGFRGYAITNVKELTQ
jgi:hypothetical protein